VNEKTNRLYHVNICPVGNYFVSSGNKNFVGINNALLELKEEQEQTIEQQKVRSVPFY
jgi:hypothetical protein